jgi:hypothetical protein
VESPDDLHNRMGRVEITGVGGTGDGDRVYARANLLALEPCAPLAAGASS